MADPITQKTHTVVESGSDSYSDPSALGFDATMLVGLSMLVVFALMLWKKVPAAIAKALDGKIAAIRAQLDEASALREEAEALKAEYEGRARAAVGEAAAMIDRARHEAEAIRLRAEEDTSALVERRTRMAEDRIAAEERSAVQALRASATQTAAKAAVRLIGQRHDALADKALVDRAIGGIAS